MARLHEDRVVLVTGAGGGVGRGYALEFARHGAKVLVNDLGGSRVGDGSGQTPADSVVAEIKAMGGQAAANYGNVTNWDDGAAMIRQAIDTFGDLHAVVCNAGILRDRLLVNMTESEWDSIMQVHLKGTFVPCRHAAAYWRDQAKNGEKVHRSIITTSSYAGLMGNFGQTNYSPAKAHLAMMAQMMAAELARFHVTVNCIAPAGLTRMTKDLMPKAVVERRFKSIEKGDFEAMDPDNNAAPVVWLTSPEASDITGRVFMIEPPKGGTAVVLVEPYTRGATAVSMGKKFETKEMGGILRGLVAQAKVPTFADTYLKGQAKLAGGSTAASKGKPSKL